MATAYVDRLLDCRMTCEERQDDGDDQTIVTTTGRGPLEETAKILPSLSGIEDCRHQPVRRRER